MTKGQKWFVLICLTLGIAAGPTIYAQLQQSGGPGSAVTATQSGTWTVQPGNTANTIAWKVDGSAVTQPVSGTVTVNALPTGSNLIGNVYAIPKTACANTVASQALAAVPTSSTAVFIATTCLETIVLNNTNATSVTVTVTDNAGTPINDVLTFSIPANSQLIQPLNGIAFTSGVKWSASGTGVTGGMLGYQ